MTLETQYPGFNYDSQEIEKYIIATGFFTLLLKNGDIIHYEPTNKDDFQAWLEKNGIINIRTEKGWVLK